MNARPEGDSRRSSRFAAHVRRIALAAAAAAAVWAIAAKWPQVRIALGQMSLPALAAAAAASFAYVALTMLSWQAVIGIRLSAASRIFFVSQIAKYLPGGVWNFVAVGEAARGHSISRRRSVSSLAVAVAISIVVGAMLALPSLLAAEGLRSRYWWLLAAVPMGIAVLWPSVLNRCLNAALRLARREPLERPVSGRAVLRSALISLLAWLAIGLQVYVLLTALGMEAGAAGLARSIGGYALGWTAGFLVFFVPAGVGVREVALGAALAGAVDVGSLVVVVITSRVLVTVADLVAGGLALAVGRGRPRQPGGGGHGEPGEPVKAADAGDGADWRRHTAPWSAERGRFDVVGQHMRAPSFAGFLPVLSRLSPVPPPAFRPC